MELPYAEDIGHYWKTGLSSPDVWMEKTRKLIEGISGEILAEGFGATQEREAFMMSFAIGMDKFKVIWPVLPTRTNNKMASRRQAATLLYHDIKAKSMTASVLGADVAFFSYLMLQDGRVASELAMPELSEAFPLQLREGR